MKDQGTTSEKAQCNHIVVVIDPGDHRVGGGDLKFSGDIGRRDVDATSRDIVRLRLWLSQSRTCESREEKCG